MSTRAGEVHPSAPTRCNLACISPAPAALSHPLHGVGLDPHKLAPQLQETPSMLTLCGSPISNYYNKVKLALLEKGVRFTEEFVPVRSTSDAVLAASPLAKIPYI